MQHGAGRQLSLLVGGGHAAVAGQHQVDGLHGDVGAEVHQSVVDVFRVGLVGQGEAFLQDNAARVDVVVEEKGGHTRLGLAVDDGPVDGCRTAILRQQGGVHVESAEPGHGPHHLGQHAKGHHHLQVGLETGQFGHEVGVFHLDGLEHGDAVGQRILLHFGGLQLVLVPPHGLVGLGDHGHHAVALVHEAAQRAYGKLGRAHEYDAEIFLFHSCF